MINQSLNVNVCTNQFCNGIRHNGLPRCRVPLQISNASIKNLRTLYIPPLHLRSHLCNGHFVSYSIRIMTSFHWLPTRKMRSAGENTSPRSVGLQSSLSVPARTTTPAGPTTIATIRTIGVHCGQRYCRGPRARNKNQADRAGQLPTPSAAPDLRHQTRSPGSKWGGISVVFHFRGCALAVSFRPAR
jgi:hypothetical protein